MSFGRGGWIRTNNHQFDRFDYRNSICLEIMAARSILSRSTTELPRLDKPAAGGIRTHDLLLTQD